MSQSDYIKYKRTTNKFAVDKTKDKPVLDASVYTDYMQYTLEQNASNDKPVLNRLTPTGKRVVWNMYKPTIIPTPCLTFAVCRQTNSRPNRVPLSSAFFVPTPQPLSWKSNKNAATKKNGCICALNKSYSQKYLCACKTSV